ncbi:hypothetical protein DICPUDRAFT_98028 [Dictyostelium purpureum]|uniref:Transmembrane 9 superfamily member n=1 Tax=Dictyostelium purpureum TaxID=5786 RepID=F0ZM00_DICPU|nr:uncharacterized protein DICPUDRAFT_98028 [Dictyostelium purpureum]EGC35014.1 hypothetical protein DICPUDRAFT_98028 [Dictyostelium purpureum]|eukprot:XP_003288442.1 hypothetical protein DICPUDRAFT_98028 [Dictyostelium purpureum]
MKKKFVGIIIIIIFIFFFSINSHKLKVINGTNGGGLSEDGSSHLFQYGEDIQFYYNYITPYDNPQQLYSLEKLQLCLTDGNQIIGQHKKQLSFILSFLDKQLIDSSIPIMFAKNFNETLICNNKITKTNKKVILDSIKQDYILKVYIDNIPSFLKIGRVINECKYSNHHDPKTATDCKKSYYINTYYKISLHYNKNRLINVDINPLKPVLIDENDDKDINFKFTYSIEWYTTEESSNSRLTRHASQISLYTMIISIVNSAVISIIWILILGYIYYEFNKNRFNAMKTRIYNSGNSNNNNNNNTANNNEVTYDYNNDEYDHNDIESSIGNNSEQKPYRQHQASSPTSISKYTTITDKKYNNMGFGPKISKYNLIKPIKYSDLFISLISLGVQLFSIFILAIILLVWKSKTLSSKTLLDSAIILYPISSILGGYVSSFMFLNSSSSSGSNNNNDTISNNSSSNIFSNSTENWIKTCIYSSYFIPTVVSTIIIFTKIVISFSSDFDSVNGLSIVAWGKLSTAIITLFFLGSPLSMLSFYLNIRKSKKNNNNNNDSLSSSSPLFLELIISISNATSFSTQTFLNNAVKRYSFFYNNYLLVLICGIFPFSIIYTFGQSVMKYLFTRGYLVINRWYSTELLAFFFVLLICNILFSFIIINYGKDHQWQWWSFFSSFSISIYIMAHFLLYRYQETQFTGFIQIYFFYLYSIIISSLFGVMCGTIGYLTSNYYIGKLFLNK